MLARCLSAELRRVDGSAVPAMVEARPNWVTMPRSSELPHRSTIVPSLNRLMCSPRTAIDLPVRAVVVEGTVVPAGQGVGASDLIVAGDQGRHLDLKVGKTRSAGRRKRFCGRRSPRPGPAPSWSAAARRGHRRRRSRRLYAALAERLLRRCIGLLVKHSRSPVRWGDYVATGQFPPVRPTRSDVRVAKTTMLST